MINLLAKAKLAHFCGCDAQDHWSSTDYNRVVPCALGEKRGEKIRSSG